MSLPLQNFEHVGLPLWFATAFATASPLRLPLPAGRVRLTGALAPRGSYLASRDSREATLGRSDANSQPNGLPRAPQTRPGGARGSQRGFRGAPREQPGRLSAGRPAVANAVAK